jgi:Yip1 domain
MEDVMDTNKIIARAKATLLTPKTEWPIIAAEPDTVQHLYENYILVLAAIPAIVSFLRYSVVGMRVPFVGTLRVGVGSALVNAIVAYVMALVGVYIVAVIIDSLAPSFQGERNRVQALKTVAYAYTAFWVASIIGIIPGLTLIAAIAGLIYGIYLLRLGLPFTMKCPDSSAVGYTAVSIIVAVVVGFVLSLVVGAVLTATPFGIRGQGFSFSSRAGGSFTPSSGAGAALQAWSARMSAAANSVDAAQKSGDSSAQAAAAAQLMTAALGAGASKVESLPPDRIKAFLPDSLGGLHRTDISAERNAAMGLQISKATAVYSDGAGHTVHLEITDTGSLKGIVGAAASWAGVEQERETSSGYDRTYRDGGQLIHEKWDGPSHSGEYAVVVASRFSVTAQGSADGIGDLKSAVRSVDLSGLEALKNSGVQN